MVPENPAPKLSEEQPEGKQKGITRRAVVVAAAWSVPAITLVVATPAYAASNPQSFDYPTVLSGWTVGSESVTSGFTTSTSSVYRVRFSADNTAGAVTTWTGVTAVVSLSGAGLTQANTVLRQAGTVDHFGAASTTSPAWTVTTAKKVFTSPAFTLAAGDVVNLALDLTVPTHTAPGVTVTVTLIGIPATGGGSIPIPGANVDITSTSVRNLPDLLGSGTSASPYQIWTKADLDESLRAVNSDTPNFVKTSSVAGSKYYAVEAPIDYGSGNWQGYDYFTGNFNGGGQQISNLKYVASTTAGPTPTTNDVPAGTRAAANLGFFRVLDGATVSQLYLNNVTINASISTDASSNQGSGGIAYAAYSSTVERCYVLSATMTLTGQNSGGGILARAFDTTYAGGAGTTLVTNSEFRGGSASSADGILGGIVGYASGTGVTISNNFQTCSMTGTNAAVTTASSGSGLLKANKGYALGGILGYSGGSGTGPTVKGNSFGSGDLIYSKSAGTITAKASNVICHRIVGYSGSTPAMTNNAAADNSDLVWNGANASSPWNYSTSTGVDGATRSDLKTATTFYTSVPWTHDATHWVYPSSFTNGPVLWFAA